MLFSFLFVLIILGILGGYAVAFIDPIGMTAGLLGGILVVLTYIAIQVTPKE
ncbi:hypothetical protein [Alteribacter aurantiacus]|uniref:hypothetical protein n=1 Tax=Alteribacter aurantiacus TaxID=254410 RepID=UPI00041FB227|nr:hypothetical protein [Alteribacter aurantiacus]